MKQVKSHFLQSSLGMTQYTNKEVVLVFALSIGALVIYFIDSSNSWDLSVHVMALSTSRMALPSQLDISGNASQICEECAKVLVTAAVTVHTSCEHQESMLEGISGTLKKGEMAGMHGGREVVTR
ncbi:hypothetical protein STEG23_012785, partial [Scotinomys teguina]